VAHRLHHHLSQVRLRRLVQFSSIGFQFHTRTTHHALFSAPVSKRADKAFISETSYKSSKRAGNFANGITTMFGRRWNVGLRENGDDRDASNGLRSYAMRLQVAQDHAEPGAHGIAETAEKSQPEEHS
ncbi:hypothetical protein, partial [Burkholderia ubonensis]|uniref:hypothetical protein n=1 Tax=Burkholderia ubonensis TaxID=101571 RepID=UPI0012F8A4EF